MKSEPEFFPADPVFALELVRLWRRTFIDAYRDEHSMENLESYCAQNYSLKAAQQLLSDKRCSCVVARRGVESVGFYVVVDHACPLEIPGGFREQSVELKQIYMLGSEFGSGLGIGLMEHAMSEAKRNGFEWMWLYVSNRNHRAKRFYLKNGFTAIGDGVDFQVGEDHLTSTCLVLRL